MSVQLNQRLIKMKLGNEVLEYHDKKNNLYINWQRVRAMEYNHNEKDNRQAIMLHILDGQYDRKKPRAPKGLTRHIMCLLLEYILKNSPFENKRKKIKMTTGTIIFVHPVDIHDLGNIRKLRQMYGKMTFRAEDQKIGAQDPYMGTTIGDLMRWCKTNYDMGHSNKGKKAQASGGGGAAAKPKAQPKAEFIEVKQGRTKIKGEVQPGGNKVICMRCESIVNKNYFKQHTETKKCKRGV